MTIREFDLAVSGLPSGEGMPRPQPYDPRALAEMSALQLELEQEKGLMDAYFDAIDRAEAFAWIAILAGAALTALIAARWS